MKPELDKILVASYPLLYADRYENKKNTLMCWGFSCGDGWFDLISELSQKIESEINDILKECSDFSCATCGCEKRKHYGCATSQVGKCLAIYKDPTSKEEPPGNYRACFCEKYKSSHPRAAQVKEKYGGLKFYMTSTNDKISALISEAEALSLKTCELCGSEGKLRKDGWWSTRCDECYKNKKVKY